MSLLLHCSCSGACARPPTAGTALAPMIYFDPGARSSPQGVSDGSPSRWTDGGTSLLRDWIDLASVADNNGANTTMMCTGD